MARHAKRVIKSISLSTIKLLVAVVFVMPMEAGNTRARTTSPIRNGKTLFNVIEPRNGALQAVKPTSDPVDLSITDHLNTLNAYPMPRNKIPKIKYV